MIPRDNYVKPIPPKPIEPKPPTQPQTQAQTPPQTTVAFKQGEPQYIGATNRYNLDKKYDATLPTPSKALDQINNLPKPDPSDKAAVEKYKQQRKAIADDAINNSKPPKIEDFRNAGLNGRTAEYEYQQAKQGYDSQIRELKKISADAKNYPDKILTPYEAQQEIENLPRPDRGNPQSVLDYNNRRAAIADSALLYAKPPTREDFSSLPGRTGAYEYQEALTNYNTTVAQLKEDSNAGGTTALPTMTDAEADKAATDFINARGGVNNEDDAHGVGQDVAALAKTDPEGAALVMQKVQDKLKNTDYGDNVASGFVDSMSVEELRSFSQASYEGESVLRNLQDHLRSGDVHEGEYKQSDKIDEAITGLNPQSLQGNPEQDAKTIDEQLQKLPPSMREKYIQAVLDHPAGGAAIKYAGAMSPEGQAALGKALGDLYAKDPSGTIAALHEITDSKDATLYPWYLQSGLANAIAKSGNDGLIKEFAQNEINRAKGNPDEVRGYVNAITAYAGLSPEGLQDVMKNNPDFFKAANEAGKFDATYSGVIENGFGDLLKKAAQVTDANGNPTPEAMRLFKEGMQYAGENTFTKEGLGEFFIKHQDAIINTYLNDNGYDLTSQGLKDLNSFYKNVLFTTPLGSNAKDAAMAITAKMNATLADADRLSDQEFLDKYGKNKHDMTSLVGEQYGTMVNAMEESLKNIKDKSEAEAKQIVDVLGGIISVGEQVASVAGPEATIGSAIIGEGLKLALGAAGDDIAKGKYDEAVKELKDNGINPDNFDDYTFNDVLGKIKNREAHDSVRDAFDYVKEVLDGE